MSSRGTGLGSHLVGEAIAAAYEAGVTLLEAQVLPENHRMIEVFRESGYPLSIRGPGVVSVGIITALTDEAISRFSKARRTPPRAPCARSSNRGRSP